MAWISRGVSLVHNYQIGTVLQQQWLVPVTLGKVNADDQMWEILVQTVAVRRGSVQFGDGTAPHNFSIDVEFFSQLFLPLVTKVGRAQHTNALRIPARQ